MECGEDGMKNVGWLYWESSMGVGEKGSQARVVRLRLVDTRNEGSDLLHRLGARQLVEAGHFHALKESLRHTWTHTAHTAHTTLTCQCRKDWATRTC